MQSDTSILLVQSFHVGETSRLVFNKKETRERSGTVDELKIKINGGCRSYSGKLFEISVFDQSTEFARKLPIDVLKVVFGHLGYRDLVSLSTTSKYWAEETVKFKEASLLKSFLPLVAEKIGQVKIPCINENKDQLLQVAENIDFSQAENFTDLKNLVLAVRFKVIKILSQLSIGNKWSFASNNKFAFALIKKPKLFDRVFLLGEVYNWFIAGNKKLSTSEYCETPFSIETFCKLDALDVALNCMGIIWDEVKKIEKNCNDALTTQAKRAYYRSLQHVVKPLLKTENFNKVVDLANTRADESVKIEIVEMCMGLGKIDEGYALAKSLKIEVAKDYHSLKPIMQMVKGGKFKEAMELESSASKDLFHLADQIIAEGMGYACDNLIQEAKFDEVKMLVELSGINLDHDTVHNIYEKLAIELIKWDRFKDAVEYAKLLKGDGPYLSMVIRALCEKARFHEAKEINKDGYWLSCSRSILIKLHEIVNFCDIDEAVNKIKVSERGIVGLYMVRKLLDAGKIDKALEIAESAYQGTEGELELLKMFSEYNSRKF